MCKFIFLLVLTSCGLVYKDGKYVSDNPVEEIAEEIIHAETGLNLDVTPGTPEGK